MAANLSNISLNDILSNSVFKCTMPLGTVYSGAFNSVSTLIDIEIYSASNIQNDTFNKCSNLTSLILPGIEDYSDKKIFGSSQLSLGQLTILEGTKQIGNLLSSAIVPIDSYSKLQLKLPMSLQEIQPSALYSINCDQIFLSPNTILCSNALYNVTTTKLRFNPVIASDNLTLSSCNVDAVYCFQNDTSYNLNTQLSGCNAHEIIFQNSGNNIASISENSFSNCTNIQYIDLISSTISELPTFAFSNCNNLISVYLPNSITSYNENCFLNCHGLQNFTLDITNAKHINGYFGYNAKLKEIPSTIITIGNSGFKNVMVNNQNVSLPNLTYIGLSAFYNTNTYNATIKSIQLPTSLTNIPDYCFYNQTQLTNINLNNITLIGKYAFYNNSNITSINTNSLRSIGEYAFANTQLNNNTSNGIFELFNLPQIVNNNAFQNTNIEKLIIGNELTSTSSIIGNTILKDCANLTYIETKLTYKQFVQKILLYTDAQVDTIIANRTNPSIIIAEFTAICNKLCGSNLNIQTIKCSDLVLTPFGTGNDYACLIYVNPDKKILSSIITTAPDYSLFKSNPTLLSETSCINNNAFDNVKTGSTALTHINLNETISAASGILSNSSLSSVIGNKLTSITQQMFANSTNLKSIEARNATQILNSGLCGCIQLNNINNITNITRVDALGLAYCTNINNIPFINSVSRCDISSFLSCISIQTINSISLSNINNYAFAECHNLTSFSAPLTSIGTREFNNCKSLKSIDISKSTITTLPEYAFGNTINLNTLKLPMTITSFSNNSLNCGANNLSVYLNIDSRNNVKFNLNNAIKSPSGTLFFTNDSIYPSFVTINSVSILSVNNTGFNVNKEGKLIGIDYTINTITESSINNLTGIKSSAFNNSFLYDIELPIEWISSDVIDDNTFSVNNAPHLNTINFDYEINDSELSIVKQFYNDKTNSNPNLIIRFTNAYFTDNSFIYDTDVFEYVLSNDQYIITGVKDNIILANSDLSNGNIAIPSRYSTISSYAFSNTHYLKNITNFTNISCILPNAFTYNTTISSIEIGNKPIILCGDVFERSTIKHAKIKNKIVNIDKYGAKGYGLNDCLLFESIEYAGISSIAPSAMINYVNGLSNVQFPTTLKRINDYAFAKTIDRFPRIQNINFQELTNLTSIGKYAFYNTIQSLPNNTLKFPKKLKIIDDAAFAYRRESYIDQISGLSNEIDETIIDQAYDTINPLDLDTSNVQTIGMSAFMHNKFRNVKFGNRLNTISSYAFANPKYKFDIHIPHNVKHIGENAFYKNIILNPDNIKKNILSIDCDITNIPSILDITIDENYSAENKLGLTNATVISALCSENMYNSFIYIHNNTMMFCPSNLSINLLNKSIDKCDNNSITAYLQPYIKTISPSAFYNCSTLTSLSVYQNISNDNILNIGDHAFYNCSALNHIKNIETHEQYFYLSNINDYTFYNCQSLSNIKLLSTTEYIGDYAFTNCKNLTSMHEDNILSDIQFWKLNKIGDYAFASCDSLTVFNIPPSISSLGQHMFDNCSSLSNININIDSQQFLNITKKYDIGNAVYDLFNGINSYGTCYINFLDVIYMNNGIVKIDNEYINTYTNDDDKIFISSLNYSKFINDNKTFLNLSSINGIDQFTFSNCTNLASISFISDTENIEYIGDYAFNNCTNLISFNNNKFSGHYIGKYAFSNCTKLLKFEIDYQMCIDNVDATIQQGAFYGTSLNILNIVNIPTTVSLTTALNKIKHVFGFDITSNVNPLELPEYCVITLYNNDDTIKGKYDFVFNNLIGMNIDINRNAIIFADKSIYSVKPLLLVKQVNSYYLPAIIANTFHMNIIGRWK